MREIFRELDDAEEVIVGPFLEAMIRAEADALSARARLNIVLARLEPRSARDVDFDPNLRAFTRNVQEPTPPEAT